MGLRGPGTGSGPKVGSRVLWREVVYVQGRKVGPLLRGFRMRLRR